MTISTDTEKTFNKVQHSFGINGKKLGTKGMHLNIIKSMYNKPIPNMNTIHIKSEKRQRKLLSPLVQFSV